MLPRDVSGCSPQAPWSMLYGTHVESKGPQGHVALEPASVTASQRVMYESGIDLVSAARCDPSAWLQTLWIEQTEVAHGHGRTPAASRIKLAAT